MLFLAANSSVSACIPLEPTRLACTRYPSKNILRVLETIVSGRSGLSFHAIINIGAYLRSIGPIGAVSGTIMPALDKNSFVIALHRC